MSISNMVNKTYSMIVITCYKTLYKKVINSIGIMKYCVQIEAQL